MKKTEKKNIKIENIKIENIKTENIKTENKEINNNKLDYSIEEIVNKYSELLIEYYKFANEKIKIKIKKWDLSKYIIIRGLETITNIFNIILFYTKNLDITYVQCQKSFYLYIEFIEQISEIDNKFLNLNSRDATMYVYKKIIFELNSENEQKIDSSQETAKKLDIIIEYINIYKIMLIKIIETQEEKQQEKQEQMNSEKYILLFENIRKQLNYMNIKHEDMKIIEKFFDILYYYTDTHKFFSIIEIFMKKINKNYKTFDNIERKIYNEDLFTNLSSMTSEKFVNWIV